MRSDTRPKAMTKALTLSLVLQMCLPLGLIFLSSCSDDKNNSTTTPTNFTPITGGFLPPGSNIPITGIGGFPIPQDQFGQTISNVSGQLLQYCQGGRAVVYLQAPPNVQNNQLMGPFSAAQGINGTPSRLYVGINQGLGEAIFIRALAQGNQISGFFIELHLCQNGTFITPARPLGNFTFSPPTYSLPQGYLVLSSNAACATGDVTSALAYLTAGPGGPYNYATSFPVSFYRLGQGFCP